MSGLLLLPATTALALVLLAPWVLLVLLGATSATKTSLGRARIPWSSEQLK